MRMVAKWVGLAVLCGVCSQVRGAITLLSYETQAQANAYAPLDRSAYFVEDDKQNVSPAVCDVSADWSGTNVGGTTNTWRMISSAHVSSYTKLTPTALTINGEGAFSYRTITTADFVDPSRVVTMYLPGANGGYGSAFTLDGPATYTIVGHLGHLGSLSLSSVSAPVYQSLNFGFQTVSINATGILLAGTYQFGAGASFSGSAPGTVRDITYSGFAQDFSLLIQIPEPTSGLIAIIILSALYRRNRPKIAIS